MRSRRFIILNIIKRKTRPQIHLKIQEVKLDKRKQKDRCLMLLCNAPTTTFRSHEKKNEWRTSF